MYRHLSELSEDLRAGVLEFLKKKPLHNIHTISSLENLSRGTLISLNQQGNMVHGVVARVETPDCPQLWSFGATTTEQAGECLSREKRFMLITDDLGPWAGNKLWGSAIIHAEHLMSVSRSSFLPAKEVGVRRLSAADAAEFLYSFQGKYSINSESKREAGIYLEENDCFGLFAGEKIAARGRIQARSSMGWAIGGIFTAIEQRNKGYATYVVSSLVEHALSSTETVIIYVRKDNGPAIRAYRKLGFELEGERYFVDFSTGTP